MPEHEDLEGEIDPRSLKRRAVRGGAATVGSQGVKFVVRIASQILIARLLAPADYGLVAMVAPILALVQLVADLGLGQAIVQRAKLHHEEISSLFWFALCLNLAVALCIAAGAPLLAWAYGEPRLTWVAIALAAVIPISGSAMAHGALLSRNLRFGTQALLDIGPPVIGLACGYAAALRGMGYWSLVIAGASENVSRSAMIWSVSKWRPGRPAYDRRIWSMVKVGGDVAGYNIANYVTGSFDNILLAAVGGKVELGLYDRGYRMVAQPLGQLVAPFSRVALPSLVRLMEDESRYRAAYLMMVQVMLLAGAPAMLFLMTFSRPVIQILLGDQWLPASAVISWFCFGALASSVHASTFWLFVSQGRTRQQLKYAIAMSVISVTLFAIALPWGAVGVSASGALSYVLISTPLVCRGATSTGAVRGRDLIGALAPLVFAAVPTFAAMQGLLSIAHMAPLAIIVVALATSYCTFAAALMILPQGRRLLRNSWNLRTTLRPAR